MTGLFQQQYKQHMDRVNQQQKQMKQGAKVAQDQSGMQLGAPMGVVDRVNQITSQNSPIMRRAETRGMQQAGRRGLLNSSMGVQAAQAAIVDAAMPMAQTDADLENRRYMQTQEFGQRDKEQDRDIDFRNKEFAERTRQFNVGFEFDKDKFAEDKRQFGEKYALEKQGLLQNQEQFQMGYDLDREKLSQNDRQFQMGYDLDKQKLNQQDSQWQQGYDLDKDRLDFDKQNISEQREDQDRRTALDAFQNTERLVAQLFEAAMQPGLPKEAKQALINQANAMRDSGQALIQQVLPLLDDLQWEEITTPYTEANEDANAEENADPERPRPTGPTGNFYRPGVGR